MPTRRYTISGQVQGVCFRAETQKKATEYCIVGWVRNLENGKVEIEADANDVRLEALEEWLREGPPLAQVDDLNIEDIPELDPTYSKTAGGFAIRYD